MKMLFRMTSKHVFGNPVFIIKLRIEARNRLPDLPTGFNFNPIDLSNDTPSRGSEHVSGEVFITAEDDENDENNSVSNSEASGDHDYRNRLDFS